jgi:hypothetical protein
VGYAQGGAGPPCRYWSKRSITRYARPSTNAASRAAARCSTRCRDPATWAAGTQLEIFRKPLGLQPLPAARWEGASWHLEPPVSSWVDAVIDGEASGDHAVIEAMLEFAVHDLGSMGIGSLLIYRPQPTAGPPVEERLPTPPPLQVRRAVHLAPLRHALAQVDGAAIFDAQGVLRRLGVRLVPSKAAETTVEALGGTRHTSARRYSYDDPLATVIVVSEDGPVSVLRNGVVQPVPLSRPSPST